MRLQIFLFLLLCAQSVFAQEDIYKTTIKNPSAKVIPMSEFRGKNLVIACINPEMNATGQLIEYRQLIKQFRDSGLVLIICITADSGRGGSKFSSEQIKQSKQGFNSQFTDDWVIIAVPTDETGGSLQEWLMTQKRNGVTSSSVLPNGRKYHINKQGHLVGIYSSQVLPMNSSVTESIKNNL